MNDKNEFSGIYKEKLNLYKIKYFHKIKGPVRNALCEQITCFNGGICYSSNEKAYCKCAIWYFTGTNCELSKY